MGQTSLSCRLAVQSWGQDETICIIHEKIKAEYVVTGINKYVQSPCDLFDAPVNKVDGRRTSASDVEMQEIQVMQGRHF